VFVSGDTCSRPSLPCFVATHRFLMLDPRHGLLSDLGVHHVYHGPYRVMLDLCIYCVPMFLDLAYV